MVIYSQLNMGKIYQICIFLLMTICSISCSDECGAGEIAFENSCYIFDDKKTDIYHLAKQDCETKNSFHLVYINSPKEEEFLKDKTNGQPFWTGGNVDVSEWHWYGGQAISAQGCFHAEDVSFKETDIKDMASYDDCISQCKKIGSRFSAVQNGSQCYCSNNFQMKEVFDSKVSEYSCNTSCKNSSFMCGGEKFRYIYDSQGWFSAWFSYGPAVENSKTDSCGYVSKEITSKENEYSWLAADCNRKMGYICEITKDNSNGKCPDEMTEIDSKCIFVKTVANESEGLTFFDAKYECMSKNGDLIKIENKNQQDGLRTTLQNNTETGNLQKYWIGLTSMSWRWGYTPPDSNMTYSNWNTTLSFDAENNCVMYTTEGWKTVKCDSKQMQLTYVCERERKVTLSTSPQTSITSASVSISSASPSSTESSSPVSDTSASPTPTDSTSPDTEATVGSTTSGSPVTEAPSSTSIITTTSTKTTNGTSKAPEKSTKSNQGVVVGSIIAVSVIAIIVAAGLTLLVTKYRARLSGGRFELLEEEMQESIRHD